MSQYARHRMDYPLGLPLTPTVKWLIVINVVIWFFQRQFLAVWLAFRCFLLSWYNPSCFFETFFLWQPITYMFLHGSGFAHIFFNVLNLWLLGSELEMQLGRKFFLRFYLLSGVLSGVLYSLIALALQQFIPQYHWVQNVYATPVVGASGAIFGLLVPMVFYLPIEL